MSDLETRTTRRRFIVRGAALSGVALGGGGLLSACGSSAGDSSSGGGGGKPAQMSILYATVEAASDALLSVVPDFQKATGVKLNVDTVAYDALQQKVFSELASSSSKYDILCVDTPWMPTIVGKVEPLSRYLTNPKLNDVAQLDLGDFIPKVFYDTTVYKAADPRAQYTDNEAAPDAKAITGNGFEIFGLPIQSNALTVSYRADLFEDPKEKAAFKQQFGRDLAPPDTWDDFVQVAKFFTRPDQNLWGTTLMAGVGDWSTDDFKTLLHCFGGDGHLVDPALKPTFATPEGQTALQFYADLINKHKVVPRGTTSASWDTVATTFGQGLTAMGMNYHDMTLKDTSKGSVKYALVPQATRRGPHFGTWMLSVNKASKQKDWAYRAVAWLTSAKAQEKMVAKSLHPTRVSVYASVGKDPAVQQRSANFYEVLGESLKVGVGRARLKNYFDVSNKVAVAVNQAASGRSAPAAALSKASSEVETLLSS